jgi:hypothetical protein
MSPATAARRPAATAVPRAGIAWDHPEVAW